MKELNDIISAYNKAISQHKQTALVTVVQVEGSSYRRPGARMLVTEDGDITGAISGGCLEGDALRKAQFAIFQQQNKLEIYDTTDDEENNLGVQLGCNGIVYILFEPIKDADPNNPVHLLQKVLSHRTDAVLATLFNLDKNLFQKGTVCYVSDNEHVFLDHEAKALQATCNNVLSQKSSVVKHYEGRCSALFQFIPPDVQLIIVGAGNDTQPMMDIAFLLGWRIIIIDGRPRYATQQRFPKANHIYTSRPSEILSDLTIDEQTAVVLMTHNYNYDIAALEQFISTNCNYIGVLGPRKKLHKMFDELKEKGIVIEEHKRQNIYGPIGIDIGAETSEEIALSAIAEIKAVFAKRQGAFLKERPTEIHERLKVLPYA